MCPHAQIQSEFLSNEKIRCVLAHDHVLLRQGLRRLLEEEPDLEVVAEAEDAAQALEMVSEYCPEVVITDTSVFGLAGDQAEQLILSASPQSKVLFLTMSESDGSSSGAQTDRTNCTLRQTSAKELGEMIRHACLREKAVVQGMRRGVEGLSAEEASRKPILTSREREVLELLAEGKTVRSAAGILGLSVKTVDAHKFNLMRKLGVHNKAELVMWAIRKRVVKLPATL